MRGSWKPDSPYGWKWFVDHAGVPGRQGGMTGEMDKPDNRQDGWEVLLGAAEQ